MERLCRTTQGYEVIHNENEHTSQNDESSARRTYCQLFTESDEQRAVLTIQMKGDPNENERESEL